MTTQRIPALGASFVTRSATISTASLAMTLTLLLQGVGFPAVAQAQEVVKIGHVGPLTGAIAHLGKDNENGARLAIE